MKLFVLEGELAELETRLPLLHDDERLAAMVELSWHLRQRDCRRALALADECEALLAHASIEGNDRTKQAARLQLVRGSIHLLFLRLDLAESFAQAALTAFSALADNTGIADARGLLGALANDRGDTATRKREWAAAAEHAKLAGDSFRLDMAESEVARGEAFADVAAAQARWGSRFAADVSMRHPATEACVGDYLALVANLSSQFGKVVTYRMRVYDASLATGQVRRAIVCALNIGHAFINLSHPLLALEWVQRALDLARPAGWPICLAMCHTQMAETLRQLGRLDEARNLLKEALSLLAPLSGSRSYALALEHLAEVLLEQGQHEAAIETFNLLEERAAALGQSNFLSVVRRGQAQALTQLGRASEALVVAGEALAVAHAQNDRIRQVNALRTLADIYSRHSPGALPLPAGVTADGAALHHLRLACKVAKTIEGFSVSASLLEALGKEYARVNNYPLAYNALVEAAEARQKVHSTEAGNLAVAMHVQRETEKLRADAEYQRQLAVTEANRAAAEIERLAWFDALTGLANRARLLDRLRYHAGLFQQNGGRFCILFLDLDHFKQINDLHGPAAGDRLLRAVAERVTAGMQDESVWARLGGDEFAMLIPHLQHESAARSAAQRILQLLAEPGHEETCGMKVTASIGIAIFPDDGADAGTLLKNAETAMHHAKESGRNALAFFTPEMGDAVLAAIHLDQRLRNAIERGEFYLCYQPKIDAREGTIVGMEALLRWRSPEPGFDSPEKFVPIIERLSVVGAVSDWVLRAACVQNRAWQDQGLPRVTVAVNLSAREFEDSHLADRVVRALDDAGLDPCWLEIELTEGALVKDASCARANLDKLTALGVSIAIDDFGTGYSSLAYLASFPIDRLKIDKSFIHDLAPGNRSIEITRTIIGIGKRLNMKIVAEGVETEVQAAFLRQEQCDELQGYLFSEAVPAEAFAALLRNGIRTS
jgi:diguanylate cyclase (GGDEF)-like protein